LIQAQRRVRRRISRGGRPTRPIDIDELRALFPEGDLTSRVVALSPNLARVAARERGLAYLAERHPFLRTHVIVTVQRAP
jgi:hypothetical protein